MAGTFFVDVFTPDTVAGFVLAVAVALALFISIAVIGILLARSLVRERQYALILQRETSTVRLFRIDRHQRQVSYFNLSDLRNVKTVPPDDFYSSFPASERERLETWVDDLLDGKPSPDYLELDVYIGKKRSKQRVPSFLTMTDVDVPKGVLHLESYLLSGMAPSEGQSFRLSTEDDFSSALKSNGSNVGFTFCFSFFPVRRGNKPANARPKLTREQVSRFRSLVAPYVKGSQRLIQCSESELLLANFDMAEKSEAIDFALRSGKGIDGLLIATRKKREPLFVCRLGIVANRDLPGDADAIIAEARNAASLARENGVGFEFYSRSREAIAPSEEAGIFKNEVDRIIDEKKIDFSYRPVYSVNRRFVYAYLALARPINTSSFPASSPSASSKASASSIPSAMTSSRSSKASFRVTGRPRMPISSSSSGKKTSFRMSPRGGSTTSSWPCKASATKASKSRSPYRGTALSSTIGSLP